MRAPKTSRLWIDAAKRIVPEAITTITMKGVFLFPSRIDQRFLK